MPSVIEFIAECLAKEIDVSDSEPSSPPAKKFPKFSECFIRNPYYRKDRKEVPANVSEKEVITSNDKSQKPLSALGGEHFGTAKAQDIPEEDSNFTLQLSETEQSDNFSYCGEEDFTLQLSEDEEQVNSSQEEQTVEKAVSPQQPAAKHIISDTPTKEKSNHIQCSDACIVSKELQTSSNEVFEEDDVKQEKTVNEPGESKKTSSPDQTPVKFFKIFKTYFQESVQSDAKKDGKEEKSSKEKSNAKAGGSSEKSKTTEASKSLKKDNQMKKLPKKSAASSEAILRKKHFCSTCRTEVESHTVLKKHMLMHAEGKEPAVCSVCKRAFTTKSALRRHLLLHSGEGRYTCPVCDKKFVRSDYLSRHHKSHKAST